MDVNLILKTHIKQNKELIKEVLKDKIIERELKIKEISNKIISIIGPRRAGKTYFLYSLTKNFNNYLFFDFSDLLLADIKIEDILKFIIKENIKVVFFDEVQEKDRWQYLVRTLHNYKFKIFITESSSKLLSKEIVTQLRRRSISYLLLPFSFKEFLRAKNFDCCEDLYKIEKIKDLLRDYLNYGGFPELVINGYKKEILKEYISLIFFKDFVERKNIKNIKTAKLIFEFLLKNYSKEISISNIRNYLLFLNIDSNIKTISNYLYEMEDTFSIFLLNKYSNKIHLKESWPKKVYLVDTGISNLFEISRNIGKKMENVVFLHLKRQENNNPFQEIYYYKTNENYEIDFLIKEKNQIKELINVSYASSYDEINKREIRALLHAKEELNLNDNVPLTIITWDYKDEKEISWFGKKGKIRFIPLWKWLLENYQQITITNLQKQN